MQQRGQNAKGFEELEHTADVALRVRGRDMRELFANAAEGMFSLIGHCQRGATPRFADEIRLHAPDRAALLIDWLNELLYLGEANNARYYAFTFHRLTPTLLEAHVAGDPLVSRWKTIKAATFHDLRISETPEGWEVTVVFDI